MVHTDTDCCVPVSARRTLPLSRLRVLPENHERQGERSAGRDGCGGGAGQVLRCGAAGYGRSEPVVPLRDLRGSVMEAVYADGGYDCMHGRLDANVHTIRTEPISSCVVSSSLS